MVQIRLLKVLITSLLIFCQNSASAQSESDLLVKVFKDIPIRKPFNEIISSIKTNNNFKLMDKFDPSHLGINGKDFFIGSILSFQGNEIFEDVIGQPNSISVVKVNNFSINSTVFTDTLDLISITIFYPRDKYRKFKTQFKKLNQLSLRYSRFSAKSTFEEGDLKKRTRYYYASSIEKLPFLSVEMQTRGYSKNERWYLLNVLHYRYR